jgi:hypothetical protein
MSSKLNKAIVHRMEDLRDVYYGREDIHIGGTHHEPHVQKQYGTADEDSVHDYESMQSSPNEDHERVSFTSGIVPKAVYKSKKSGRKFLVKAYHASQDGSDSSAVGDGFGESLIADMYRSAGIGHLIQRTHISNGKAQDLDTGGKKDMPLLVVHMEPHSVTADDFTSHNVLTHAEVHSMHPEKMKIEAMDYITGNDDRHHNNVMFRLDPHTGRPHSLMAIDNSGFNYFSIQKDMFGWQRGFRDAGFRDGYDEVHAHDFVKWWRNHSPMIRLAFHKHIVHVKDPANRDSITRHFDDRCARLDRIADHYLTTGEWKKVD